MMIALLHHLYLRTKRMTIERHRLLILRSIVAAEVVDLDSDKNSDQK